MRAPTRSLKVETFTGMSLVIYLGLMAYLIGVKVVFELASVVGVVPSQATLFSWPVIGLLTVAGSLSVWLGPRARLPDLWDPRRSPRTWLLLPAVVGLGLGAVSLTVHTFTGYAQVIADAANVPTINVPFPKSILFYSGGAIIVEALYRLILITLPLWIVGTVILRGRGQATVFWIVALLTSLVEPAGQMSLVAGHPGVMVAMGVAMYGMNVFEALLFWRYGLLAPLAFRLTFYLVWHVVGGAIGV
jgi:hypothetical protein